MLNAEMANKMWELDSLEAKSYDKHWENDMLRSMKT